MDEGEARRRVAGARVGRLATIDPVGRPHVVPFCFVLDGQTLYWAVDQKPKVSREVQRLTNIRANPAVQVLVDHYEEDWNRIWWVRLAGRARILDPGPEADRASTLLVNKFPQYREEPPEGPVVAVDLARWSTWDPGSSGGAMIDPP